MFIWMFHYIFNIIILTNTSTIINRQPCNCFFKLCFCLTPIRCQNIVDWFIFIVWSVIGCNGEETLIFIFSYLDVLINNIHLTGFHSHQCCSMKFWSSTSATRCINSNFCFGKCLTNSKCIRDHTDICCHTAELKF